MTGGRLATVVMATTLFVGACSGGGDDTTTPDDDTSSSRPSSTAATTIAAAPATTAAPTTAAPATTAAATTEPATTAPATTAPVDLYHRDLTVGSCFDTPAGGAFTAPVPPTDCAVQHDAEIFAEGVFAAAPGDPFPGDDVLRAHAFDTVCPPAYQAFTGFAADDAPIPWGAFTPDEADWSHGDRRILCVINNPGDALIGTAASAGLDASKVRLLHVMIVDGTVDLFLSGQGQEPIQVTSDPEEEQTFPPSNDAALRVYYSRNPAGASAQADIVVFDTETDIVTPVLATPFDEGAPRLSPDKTKLVYISSEGSGGDEYDIWVMNVDGTNRTQLTTNPGRDANPSWSPDGTRIVFRASTDDNSDIWIMNADGSDLQQLTQDPAGDFDPVFSPDGTRIAFTSKRTGNLDIWVMNADGSSPVNLTSHPATDEYPSWTNDGKGIAFTSDRVGTRLWIMRDDGSDQTLFTLSGPSGYGTAIGPLS